MDLTREQSGPGGTVTEGTVVPRPPEPARLREEYALLRGRVVGKLDGHPRG
ncbi:hypothetical protein ACFY3N_03895 [Streptomyces sp. NPDC000348]|uniref:hypothetical protein n=1 Tax=Streptomyces sp. NPDC000348 TaxID=3364538 RepID=UPI00367366C1